jgi:hypothetical protein
MSWNSRVKHVPDKDKRSSCVCGDDFPYEVKAGSAGPAPAPRLRRPRAQPHRTCARDDHHVSRRSYTVGSSLPPPPSRLQSHLGLAAAPALHVGLVVLVPALHVVMPAKPAEQTPRHSPSLLPIIHRRKVRTPPPDGGVSVHRTTWPDEAVEAHQPRRGRWGWAPADMSSPWQRSQADGTASRAPDGVAGAIEHARPLTRYRRPKNSASTRTCPHPDLAEQLPGGPATCLPNCLPSGRTKASHGGRPRTKCAGHGEDVGPLNVIHTEEVTGSIPVSPTVPTPQVPHLRRRARHGPALAYRSTNRR